VAGWAKVLPLFVEDAVRALRGHLAAHPDEEIYAAGFYAPYFDGNTVDLPELAVGHRRDVQELAGDLWHSDWNPAEFGHDLDYLGPELDDARAAASRRMAAGSAQDWERGERRFLDMLVKACRLIRGELDGAPQLAPNFVAYLLLHDSDAGEEVARRCIGERRFRTLFPEQDHERIERSRVAALPVPERVEYLVQRLGRFDGPISHEEAQELLVGVATPAVPALLRLLEDPDQDWMAGDMLGRIGDRRPAVITALRRRYTETVGQEADHRCCASALAYLGDTEWLLDRVRAEPSDLAAAEGIIGLYTAFRDRTPAGLDYEPLARLLDGPSDVVAVVDDWLRPGASLCTLRPAEVDTALAALDAPHHRIRRHAVDVLGDRGLGAVAGRRVLPALARAAQADPDADVRRLALLGLREWRRAALPHRVVGEAAQHDPDERVRRCAREWLDELRGTG
jgi:hypothetical protein